MHLVLISSNDLCLCLKKNLWLFFIVSSSKPRVDNHQVPSSANTTSNQMIIVGWKWTVGVCFYVHCSIYSEEQTCRTCEKTCSNYIKGKFKQYSRVYVFI